MREALIFDGIRSPIGRHGGVLARIRPDDLAAELVRYLVSRNNLKGDEVEDVIVGNTNQAGEDSRNLARHVALLAGLPVEVSGITVNRLCGSGLAAVLDARRAVVAGEGSLFIAGGCESMSRAPLVIAKAESPFSRNQKVEDSTLGARFPNSRITELYGNPSMAQTADNVAADLGISREDCDKFALASQQKYAAAKLRGFFDNEIHPVEVPAGGRKLPPVVVKDDEHPRPDSSIENLANLRPICDGGVVSAGNASGINDGAAMLIVGSSDAAIRYGLQPRARVLGAAIAGVSPRVMGLGPVPASGKALERACLELGDMDVIEINEAFAAQVLGCLRQMDLDIDDERINPNGGSIAVGHPLGASGARLILTAIRQLEETDKRYALVTMCIGVGQGIAVVIERTDERTMRSDSHRENSI